ncbi:hypothetical protein ONE63_001587 [Megalurothrips usitatus]|uniref:DOMON domain-containing protein n=1 Tax=Megalurothrips usitatus TaxID=439358 RepID=A0AAV7XGY3_9NEOP|nr:hypothetical protein ONE63_001587 [Megalurothrips usitatus]
MGLLGHLLWTLGTAWALAVVAPAADAQVFSVPLDAEAASTLHWRVDYARRAVQVEVHVGLDERAWFALGFSDYGEPAPADYCVLWRDWRGLVRLQDAHAAADGRLHLDAHQDCLGFRHTRAGNLTKFAFQRQFDTCDPDDYVIEEGTTHVVWAAGAGPLFRLDGVSVLGEGARRGMQRAQLLKNTDVHDDVPPDAWHLDVRADRVQVPAVDTTYWCHVVKVPQQLARKHHVVRYEALIQHGNEGLVHHMEVFHCEAPLGQAVPLYRGPCTAAARPDASQVCKRVLAAWAMGATPFVYPKEAGLPIGGPQFNPYVMLEVHYNNPENKSDWVDSSGIRLTLSATLRPHDGGVMELGLEYTDKMAVPPGQPHFQLTGHCIAECTEVGIPGGGITVFGSQLHTHLTGVRLVTRHVRAGRELPEMNRDNHYSTHFQEIRRLKRPVQVLPGDALVTTCTYDTRARPNVTLGGFSIQDEMCVNYIHYYPKVDLEVCKSSVSDASLQSYFRLLHELDGQDTGPHLGVSGNYRAVRWTPVRARVLSALYDEAPLAMQCNRSSGARFPGDWAAMAATRVTAPLPAAPRPCPLREHGRHGGEDEDEDGPAAAPQHADAVRMEDWGQGDDMDWGQGHGRH